jgi:hypothetical protein
LENKEVIEKIDEEKKSKRNTLKEKITQGIINFFGEDTEMESTKPKIEKTDV